MYNEREREAVQEIVGLETRMEEIICMLNNDIEELETQSTRNTCNFARVLRASRNKIIEGMQFIERAKLQRIIKVEEE
ncbi:MAG: hypothetical protein BZ138_05890 [Methanosphaera sp. rholeuAM270]|nr:MAG: hypothetical protein BZ138_05890 [Methanosphaera sp. rholeuAM270]